jgi:sigma-B regulation protein RsbU (phosphoserine phosphatase)
LLLRGRLLGVLTLGWKASEEIYTAAELEALCLIASEAAVALETAALLAEREKQARLQQEVAIGRAIQMSLLAPEQLRLPGFEIDSRSVPAMEVGGDFYDLFPLGGDRRTAAARQQRGARTRALPDPGDGNCPLGILIGDVAGKGVPAALLMAVTTTLIRGQAPLLPSPGETLAAANAELYPLLRRPGGTRMLFTTALYGVLDPASGELRFASAGQTPPIHWPVAGEPRYVRLQGVPLGALPDSRYEEAVIRLEPGDRLLLCSDGFIEASGPGGTVVGYDGFLQRLKALGRRSGPDMIAALFEAPGDLPDPTDPMTQDDRTLVLITATASPALHDSPSLLEHSAPTLVQ